MKEEGKKQETVAGQAKEKLYVSHINVVNVFRQRDKKSSKNTGKVYAKISKRSKTTQATLSGDDGNNNDGDDGNSQTTSWETAILASYAHYLEKYVGDDAITEHHTYALQYMIIGMIDMHKQKQKGDDKITSNAYLSIVDFDGKSGHDKNTTSSSKIKMLQFCFGVTSFYDMKNRKEEDGRNFCGITYDELVASPKLPVFRVDVLHTADKGKLRTPHVFYMSAIYDRKSPLTFWFTNFLMPCIFALPTFGVASDIWTLSCFQLITQVVYYQTSYAAGIMAKHMNDNSKDKDLLPPRYQSLYKCLYGMVIRSIVCAWLARPLGYSEYAALMRYESLFAKGTDLKYLRISKIPAFDYLETGVKGNVTALTCSYYANFQAFAFEVRKTVALKQLAAVACIGHKIHGFTDVHEAVHMAFANNKIFATIERQLFNMCKL